MVAYLAERHVASFTVDVVSNDSYIHDADRLVRETLQKVDANHGGIILFHDIKAATAKALPVILDQLAARGYSVVHLVPKVPMQPQQDLVTGFQPKVAKLVTGSLPSQHAMVPFFGTVGPTPRTHIRATPDDATIEAVPALSDDATGAGWSTRIRRNRSN